MPRADTITRLPISRWAEVLGIPPLHFAQVITSQQQVSTCGSVWFQYPWQASDAVSREDVAQAIMMAEEAIERELGYRLLPSWEIDERVLPRKPGMNDLVNYGMVNPRGFGPSVHLNWGHFITGGIRAVSAVQEGATVFFEDHDKDDYAETARIVVSTSVTNEEEIAVYFAATDTGFAADERWRIRPLRRVSISGGEATIYLWRHHLVRPELTGSFSPEAIDGADTDQFVASVDVYRLYNDPQTQVNLLWEPTPGVCGCGSSTCQMCVLETQTGCLHPVNPRLARVSYSAATWDSDNEQFSSVNPSVGRNPDQLRTWYRAGLRDTRQTWPTYQMDPELERAVVLLSLTYLYRPLCGCHNLEAAWMRWTEDVSLRESSPTLSKSFQTNKKMLDNPFGTTKGAIYAWDVVRRRSRRIGEAVAV